MLNPSMKADICMGYVIGCPGFPESVSQSAFLGNAFFFSFGSSTLVSFLTVRG